MITKNNFLNCIRRDFDRFDFCTCVIEFSRQECAQEKTLKTKNCVTVGVLDTTTTQVSNEILFSCSSNKNRSWHSNILAYWTGKYSVLSAKRMKSDRKFAMELFCENQRNQENFLDTRFITNCFFIKWYSLDKFPLDSWYVQPRYQHFGYFGSKRYN